MLGKAFLLAILTAAFLVHPLPAAADETQSIMNGAPNADASLRDKKGNAGPPIQGADAAIDPGIQAPGASPSGTPTPRMTQGTIGKISARTRLGGAASR